MDDQKIRLVLELLGTEGVKGLRDALSGLGAESAETAAALGRGEISAAEYDAELARIAASTKNLESVVRQLNAELSHQADSAGRQAAADEADKLAEAERRAADAARAEADAARAVEGQLREETAAIADATAKQRELKAATDACAAADRDLNRVLRDDAAAELRGKLAALDAEAGDVANAFAKGDISARIFAKDMDLIGDESAQLRAQLAGLEQAQRSEATATDRATAAKDRLEKATRKARQGMTGFSQAVLQTGRIVQDTVQGGLGGGINNIEQFTQAIGLGSGAAGALTILATGLLVFRPQIEEFVRSLDIGGGRVKDFASQLDTLSARIKEIEEKPHKLTVDVQELRDAKAVVEEIRAALAAVDKLSKSQSHYEKESGAAIEETIAEAPGGAQGVRETLRNQLEPEVTARAVAPIKAQEQAKQKELDQANQLALSERDPARLAAMDVNIERIKKELEQLTDKRIAAADDVLAPKTGALDIEVGKAMNAATKEAGDKLAAGQERLAELLKRSGREDLARGVEAASPKQLLLNDQADDELEASIEQLKQDRKDRKEAAEERKKAQQQEIDALSKSKALAPEAQQFAKDANATGAVAEDAFATVRDQITAAILAKLKEHGIKSEGAEEIAGNAAEGIAKEAFDKVGQNQTREEKAAAKDDKNQDTGIARQAREQRAKVDKESAETFDASVKNSGIADEAGSMLAEIRAAGGVKDQRTGKVHKLTPEQQFEYVRKQVERYLHRQTGVDQLGRPQFANRGMGAEETGLTAAAIAQRGQQEVTHRLAGMAGKNLSNTEKLLNISQDLDNEVTMIRQKQDDQGRRIDAFRAGRQSNRRVIH